MFLNATFTKNDAIDELETIIILKNQASGWVLAWLALAILGFYFKPNLSTAQLGFFASGGPDGAHWFFKKPNARDKWGIRVSFGSYFMALHGLAAARIHLDYVCQRLGIRFGDKDVSISRVDFCVDILAPEFTLIPEHFVMHSSTGRRDFIEDTNKAVHGKSGRTTSVTIGSSRNRQVIIYDKRAEIIQNSKAHWWGIWNHSLRAKGLPQLAPDLLTKTCASRPDPGRPRSIGREGIGAWDITSQRRQAIRR